MNDLQFMPVIEAFGPYIAVCLAVLICAALADWLSERG